MHDTIFLNQTQTSELALRELCNAAKTQKTGRNYVAALAVIAWFRRGDIRQAKETFDSISEKGNLKESFRMLAILGSNPGPTERQLLLRSFQEYLATKTDCTHFNLDWFVLRLLEESPENCDAWLGKSKNYFGEFESPMQQRMTLLCDFHLGVLDDPSDLIEQCESESSKRLTADCHFAIAIDALANGYRGEAIKHFNICVSQDVYQFYVHQWSLAFLDKLDKNPSWPPWIPLLE